MKVFVSYCLMCVIVRYDDSQRENCPYAIYGQRRSDQTAQFESDLAGPARLNITKTCLFKYTENFTTKQKKIFR